MEEKPQDQLDYPVYHLKACDDFPHPSRGIRKRSQVGLQAYYRAATPTNWEHGCSLSHPHLTTQNVNYTTDMDRTVGNCIRCPIAPKSLRDSGGTSRRPLG
jgi:hypothetical protein